MDIRTALDRIVALQEGLSISAPVSASILKAYKYPPPAAQMLADTPCFINTYDLVSVGRAPGGLRRQHYDVRMQLFVDDADEDRAADIASAFLEQLIVAFDADITLAGAASNTDLRGADPTLVELEWANRGYVGLDLHLDVFMYDTGVYAP